MLAITIIISLIICVIFMRNKPKSTKNSIANAGGGGERVLWTAIYGIQQSQPSARIFIYTGDSESKETLLSNVKNKMSIELNKNTIEFIRLRCRSLVDDKSWPYFTLLGQAIGSILLILEAMYRCNGSAVFIGSLFNIN
ncbi:UDP-Glycosyltransferase/glycogen phosphorylase [Wallemia mellicola]|uniref:UDP-Glycosyltransferase/glycogen phosphorylase n=1 Tax=Wallemia mellicola TaxID=1708541 RepID=A0A4T0PDJ6_9BASI|nr:UDP-Glycosyltransferase/glycogen phosphorylase [Wallemia mellicola]TIC08690.1 UDP-Glycosyltransferase/glycogen phosphorylase [Wallemia mellicola]